MKEALGKGTNRRLMLFGAQLVFRPIYSHNRWSTLPGVGESHNKVITMARKIVNENRFWHLSAESARARNADDVRAATFLLFIKTWTFPPSSCHSTQHVFIHPVRIPKVL